MQELYSPFAMEPAFVPVPYMLNLDAKTDALVSSIIGQSTSTAFTAKAAADAMGLKTANDAKAMGDLTRQLSIQRTMDSRTKGGFLQELAKRPTSGVRKDRGGDDMTRAMAQMNQAMSGKSLLQDLAGVRADRGGNDMASAMEEMARAMGGSNMQPTGGRTNTSVRGTEDNIGQSFAQQHMAQAMADMQKAMGGRRLVLQIV